MQDHTTTTSANDHLARMHREALELAAQLNHRLAGLRRVRIAGREHRIDCRILNGVVCSELAPRE